MVPLGPTMSMLLGIAGSARRAVASAIYAFFVNLISMGVGPLVVGALSDSMQPRYGNDSLRYAILMVVIVATLWAAIHFLLAARTLKRDGLRQKPLVDGSPPVKIVGFKRQAPRGCSAGAVSTIRVSGRFQP